MSMFATRDDAKTRDNAKTRLRRLALMAAGLVAVSGPSAAQAQDYGRRNLMDMLFGGPRYEEREAPPSRYEGDSRNDGSIIDMAPRRNRARDSVKTLQPRDAATPAASPTTPPAPAPVAKLENARTILVIGDFLAASVGGELENTFAASPGVQIVERSDTASGLVRSDHFDWQAELPAILDDTRPAIVVVLLGANDRQQMIDGGREKFRTDAWFAEYQRRVDKLTTLVTARKLPLLWVGLPAFQSPSMTADAVTLNTLYRNQVEKDGGEFVDIWDGFTDEDGKFVITGSDVSGQQVRLRGPDGISFTKAGRQKLAFYVEKFLRRHLGDMASPDIANIGANPGVTFGEGQLPPLSMTPSFGGATVPTQPISLADPKLDGGDELLGGAPPAPSLIDTPRDKLVKRGEMDPAPAGRIDDYRIGQIK